MHEANIFPFIMYVGRLTLYSVHSMYYIPYVCVLQKLYIHIVHVACKARYYKLSRGRRRRRQFLSPPLAPQKLAMPLDAMTFTCRYGNIKCVHVDNMHI